MTVLRREDVQSRVARWDESPYRISSSPILAIVPLIIRRLRGPSPHCIPVLHSPVVHAPLIGYRNWLKRRPQKARELARDGDCDLGGRLMFRRQFPEAPTQTLLRLIGNCNHAPGLALAPPRQRDADAWPM